MAGVELTGLPEDATIVQGYFVWSGFDSEGRRIHGGVEYPLHQDEDGELAPEHDYDGLKTIGMLTVARKKLLHLELCGEEEG